MDKILKMNSKNFEISVVLADSFQEETWYESLTENISVIHPARFSPWGDVLETAFHQKHYTFLAFHQGRPVGVLPLVYMKSMIFGKFLIGQPYLNVGGIFTPEVCESFSLSQRTEVERLLVEKAVYLADKLDVRYLELRNEHEVFHPALNYKRENKVLMRLELPETEEELWKQLSPKVRNQIRKGERAEHTVMWGGRELVGDFYEIFAEIMRDVGTPVYPRRLFELILEKMPETSEICVVSDKRKCPVAAALLLHGRKLTEVPSAAALHSSHVNCANMFMYWHLLKHSVERGQKIFDFGRSNEGSNTWRFKKQWGTQAHPSVWQYYVRRGGMDDVRPEGYGLAIRVWKKLPVWLTKMIGPFIVRGIP
ncbi:MAG: FemAB family PEP-CTERM system-associated protein [Planctomycetia bacterium]|nr:FemAB family PEP-CTERM system-associated protein [Planctomycetia bacterium]